MAKAKPLFMDSFHYDIADVLKKWTGTTSTGPSAPLIGTAYGRVMGERGLYSGSTGGASRGYYRLLPSTYDTVVFGGWYYSAGYLASASVIFGMANTTTNVCAIISDGAGHLALGRAGVTLVGSYSTAVAAAGWHWLEAKVYIHASAGSYEIKCDGTSFVSASGLNTGTGAASSFVVCLQNGQVGQICSPFVADASGATYVDFLGPQMCVPRLIAANGNYTAWTPNFGTNAANVGGPTPDMDQSFNYASSASTKDSFTGVPLPGTGGISGIQHVILARTDGSTHTLRPFVRISGTDYPGTTANVGSSYAYQVEVVHLSPATSAAWTYGEINGMEQGYELVS